MFTYIQMGLIQLVRAVTECIQPGGSPGSLWLRAIAALAGIAFSGVALGQSCSSTTGDCADLKFGASGYPKTVYAEEVLRSDITAYGVHTPNFAARLDLASQQFRIGEVLITTGVALSGVAQESSGDYSAQVAKQFSTITDIVESVVAAGGRVQLMIHCGTPEWLATYPYPHDVVTGKRVLTENSVSACSTPSDMVEWRRIMQAIGEHFGPYADKISVAIGSEPETYFVGSRDELLDWYSATAKGLLDSSNGSAFRMGGLTVSSLHLRQLSRVDASITENGDIVFESATYNEPITKTWIQHLADTGLPLNFVTIHQFDASPVPSEGAYWKHSRRDISSWLTASGYQAEKIEVLIEDFPQWSPYESNDSEYFASHMASGIISMLDLSLRGGQSVRPLQAFLFDYGFRPPGKFLAGFTGRPGMSNEFWINKPVFNMNSLMAELQGVVKPVESDDPFIHAIGAVEPDLTSILISHHVPHDTEVSLSSANGTNFSILANHFSSEDLSKVVYRRVELFQTFFNSTLPTLHDFLEAVFESPSAVDFNLLNWPEAIKAKWFLLQKIGQMARIKRRIDTIANLHLEGMAPGSYRLQHYVIDSQLANSYSDRESLQQRLEAAAGGGKTAVSSEIININREYDALSGNVTDLTVTFKKPIETVSFLMEPNSVHLIRLSAVAQ